MKFGRVFALAAWFCLRSSSALAEGSADFDLGETLWNGSTGNRANDQAVDAATVIRVDITGSEKVCWNGVGTMQLIRPDGTTNVGAAIASGSCANVAAGVTGAYYADIGAQTVETEWDIRVCLQSTVGNCVGANESLGRIWSTAWSFQQNANFTNDYAVNGSVFAVVPGGAVGHDAVIEMKMNGVSGAHYVLRANSTGPVITSTQARFGRSAQMGTIYSVNAEYPLYLSTPADALYNWTPPAISNVQLTPACGTGVVLNRAAGQISFTSNVVGQYVVVCDVNKDSAYDFAGTTDFSSFGTAAVGSNTISWDGRDNAGVNVAEGSYNCIVRLNVGEFHYVAEDIETSYPGIRMFRVGSDRTTKTPIRMFWDDRGAVLASGTNTMLNGQAAPSSPLADGLDPTAITNASAAFYFTGGDRTMPHGNARAWHNFTGTGTGTGLGNNNYLDQFAAADTAISPALSISVISNGGDADSDGLTNARECDLGSLPQDNDTDNDGVRDGYEATTSGTSTNTDGDSLLDVLDPDDDGDGVPTLTELGPGENGDGNPADAANSDGVGPRDYLDTDSDNDGVLDGVDIARTNPLSCRDVDADNCDDCSVTGANSSGGNISNDGLDTNTDGQCNLTDDDDDGDGVLDGADASPLVSTACRDSDGDGCDDCSGNNGPLPLADGPDNDNDGACNVGDPDDDNDGVPDLADSAPFNPNVCRDVDADGCNDCILSGANNSGGAPAADGIDTDLDGLCDAGDPDRDNDGVPNAQDSAPLNPSVCRDVDGDACNDCGLTGANNSGGNVGGDGTDTDADGLCDAGDPDRDNDGVPNAQDSAPLDAHVCRDLDGDGCNDCAHGSADPANDGTDNDGDGKCDAPTDFDGDGINDANDLDDDGDGILDTQENSASINPDGDADNDGISNLYDVDNRGDGMPSTCSHARSPKACDAPSALFDQDGDGKPNHLDLDADGDGLSDASESGHDAPDDTNDGRVDGPVGANGVADSVEDRVDSGVVTAPIDTDGDKLPDFLDVDSDADGVQDGDDERPLDTKHCRDTDNDGCDDCTSGKDDVKNDGRDQDGDGRCDPPVDRDLDGIPNVDDLDDDGDGILDSDENTLGLDPDGDNDGDGIANFEDADDRGDGQPNDCTSLSNVRCTAPAALWDQDGDGTPNHLDLDADGDGIYDADESGHNATDRDADGRVDGPVGKNGVADSVESAPDSGRVEVSADTDGDGKPDFLDLDSDDDGVSDADEAGDTRPNTPPQDSDSDGAPDYRDLDDDGDGIDTVDERSKDGKDIDSDEDGTPDYLDVDDDDDGIPTSDERTPEGKDLDTDKDGTPNHLDDDDDGDGVPTNLERSKDGHDIDTDGDGKPDYLDVDDDGDGIPTQDEPEDANSDGVPDRLEPKAKGTLSGGALCSLEAGKGRAPDASALGLLLIAGAAVLRRRRRTALKKNHAARTRWLGLLSLTLLAVSGLSSAHAQVALDQFKPAPLTSDGFALSRPNVLETGKWSAMVLLDYANDPLVYEVTPGSSKHEERVVGQHLVGHVGFAVGVAKRLTLFAGLPVHMIMKGQKNLTVDAPKPEGAGIGDLAIGGRLQISGLDPKSVFASAFEFVARAPTADLANKDQHYSGDAIGSYEPVLIGEVRAGRFDVRLRAGARLRQKTKVGNLTLGQEWIGGLGMRLRVASTIYLNAEAYGSTFMNKAFDRTTTPVEALFGIKHQGQSWNLGAAAGPGLHRGYGSPDVRVVGMLGYAPTEKKPVDSDGDGLLDPQDKCPKAPEDLDHFEDQDGCPDLDNDKDGLPDSADSCIDEPEDTDDFEDTDGCPDRDNDKDGIIDESDTCPLDPEDSDQFEDEDGCVDPDNDRDGILDQADSCPNKPEDIDGFEDQDGCPEEGGGKVKLGCAKIEIGESVYFDSGKDTIQSRSFELLDQVAAVLAGAKHILKVRVAGHTDDRGNDKKNLDLSKRRAASVLRYLSAHGIDGERLSSDGYGESEPIASNKTADGRAQNRRVEFQIIEQSGECH
jgi:outer membrane protein OmpA-like peptidoglycan-associated protein